MILACFAGTAYPPLPSRASPPQGGRSASGEHTAHYHRLASVQRRPEAAIVSHRISPLEGEMAGRPEGGMPHPQFSMEASQ
jgi:hypothetical protein